MKDEELNERFSLLAESVSRVADASANGIRQLVETTSQRDERMQQLTEASAQRFTQLDDRIRQLVDVQLATQQQIGHLSQVVLESREETRRLQLKYEEESRQFRQRQEESDQRFEVLLQEIRYLIKRTDPGQLDTDL